MDLGKQGFAAFGGIGRVPLFSIPVDSKRSRICQSKSYILILPYPKHNTI
jgi:hypothetical protein